MRTHFSFRPLSVLMLLLIASGAMAQITAEQETAAMALLEKNGIEIEGKYQITRYVAYKSGGGMISVRQIHDGLVVFDSDMAFHFAAGGKVKRAADGSPFVGGIVQDVDDLVVDRDRLVSKEQAMAAFSAALKTVVIPNLTGRGPRTEIGGPECAKDSEAIEAALGIYRSRPAWRVTCRGRRYPLMYIDAVEGSRLFLDSGIRA